MDTPPPRRRLPPWFKRHLVRDGHSHYTGTVLRKHRLHTVCEEARCPNRHECYSRKVATFLLLGDRCTRGCTFCATATACGDLPPPDADEPERVAAAAADLGLAFVVLTSVTRDDLADGGASIFAATVAAIRRRSPQCRVEVLTPDFAGATAPVETVLAAAPDVFNHNLETVPRLYTAVRPGADYRRSLDLLAHVKARAPGRWTKSGLMVGLGESDEEIAQVMRDLRAVGTDILTIGQYLRPRLANRPVDRFVEPAVYERYRDMGREIGFSWVAAGPYVRSSYQAEAVLQGVVDRKLNDAS